MSLTVYKRKRDFRKTPEPTGRIKRSRRGLRYVIQKHDASRLHYDFRLEWDGVLKSWAVPKGPSLDPAVKSLAVQVEDHPLDYGGFEGIIPEGQYGGGTVMLWDEGTWTPEGDAARSLKAGKLTFELHGKKLSGRWKLIRTAGRDGDRQTQWLLMKSHDEAARPGTQRAFLDKESLSVKSGRDLDEIAGNRKKKVWQSDRAGKTKSKKAIPKRKRPALKRRAPIAIVIDPAALNGARPAPQPTWVAPQLATLADGPPDGADWVHEVKFDGYRLIAIRRGDQVKLWTRNHNDWTDQFEAIAGALRRLPVDEAIIDGEVVALNEKGHSDFQALQRRLQEGGRNPMAYAVFDLLHCNGYDVRSAPLLERKQLLKTIVDAAGPDPLIQYSEHATGDGGAAVKLACKAGLEGLIFKKADAAYESRRTPKWLKVKCTSRREFVIGGFTDPQRSRTGFGALLLGDHDARGRLTYRGRVGTGFSDTLLTDMHRKLARLEQPRTPFHNPPTGYGARGVHWVKPQLVAEVTYQAITSDGLLRQPSFDGLRLDKKPSEVIEESAVPVTRQESTATRDKHASQAQGHGGVVSQGVVITHPDRIVFPNTKITKSTLADYYTRVGERMLPHMTDRPLMLARCPGGAGGQCFYQKHITMTGKEPIDAVKIKEKSAARMYAIVDTPKGLAWLVQMNTLEIHGWGSCRPRIEMPDRLIFDLDPGEGVAWNAVVDAALLIRKALRSVKIESFVKTSGGKGLHIVAPLTPSAGWDAVKGFAQQVAQAMAESDPDLFVSKMTKSIRGGKIFIDYLRNGRGASCVLPYSTRARPGAPVSMPVAWSALKRVNGADAFTVSDLMKLRRLPVDPWAEFFEVRQKLPT